MPDIFISEGTDKKEAIKLPADIGIPDKAPKTEKEKAEISGHVHSPLASFCLYPDNVNFETKESEEGVILLLRKHIVTNVGWVIIAVLMVFAQFVLDFFPILAFLPSRFQFVAVLIWYLLTLAFVLENFFTWFFNVYIVTDERVVDVDFYNLIYKQVSDANIDRIQDVTYKMGGVTRTLFNYGDVYIQTASEVPNFEFLAVPYPDRVAKIFQDLIIKEENEGVKVKAA